MSDPKSSVTMPQLGESIVEATLVRWRVRPGEPVSRGQIIAEVETDKATNEIPAPRAGIVRELLAPEGTTLPVGAPILTLADGEAAPPTAAPPEARPVERAPPPAEPPRGRLPSQHLAARPLDARGGPTRTSPAVRRLARRFGVDLGQLKGSGKNGRITREDVQRALAAQKGTSSTAPLPAARGSELSPLPTAAPRQAALEPRTELPLPLAEGPRTPAYRPPIYRPKARDRVLPFSRRRAQIAQHMRGSLDTSAHVFALAEIDMGRVLAARTRDQEAAARAGVKLSFLPYVLQAVAQALEVHPELNAVVQDQALVLRGERNLGVAVDTPEGLVVPVVKRADERTILGIARELEELAERARAGKLSAEDVAGGSFTISNPGRDGNLIGLSIIRQPEVGILRLGSIVKRPVVREIEGEELVVVRPIMMAALSYDHRVIDGRTGNAFLALVTRLLAQTEPATRDAGPQR